MTATDDESEPVEETTWARVLVTGSVFWDDYQLIDAVLTKHALPAQDKGRSICIITGTAAGADEIARSWARREGIEVFAHDLNEGPYPVPMHRYNEEILALEPDLVLAFKERFDDDWQSEDCIAGTEHMCRIAAQAGVRVLLNGYAELTIGALRAEADAEIA